MAYYSYECLDKNGQLINGQISAEGISQAVDKLKRMGLSVIDLKENKPKKKSSFFSNEKKPTITDLALFSRQLAAMLAAGIPVTRALLTLSQQAENKMLKEALETIHSNVEGGMNLTEAFSLYPHIFNDLYISMINAGETGGMLETSLLRLSEQLQKEKVLRDEVKSAISYPRTIAIFALVMFVAMVVFLVPVFQKFIPETSDIPAITQLIFNLSASWRNYYYIWIAAITAIVSGFILFAKSKTGRDLWEKNKFRMPVFGMLLLKTVIARFTRTLSTLLRGGITVVQALESAGPTSGSALVSETVKKTVQGIEEGRSIASTFEQSGLFPPMVTQMVAVGEESGTLPELLEKIAEFYEQEVQTTTKGLQALIQPIAIIVIGLLVGGMLVALYLPIFTTVSSSGGI
ncbi:MAG: type II secretion system F family protein [Clostridiaceae bacterium]|nr:type II secretion system F family protein [Clostridiaceae bacterium]